MAEKVVNRVRRTWFVQWNTFTTSDNSVALTHVVSFCAYSVIGVPRASVI